MQSVQVHDTTCNEQNMDGYLRLDSYNIGIELTGWSRYTHSNYVDIC